MILGIRRSSTSVLGLLLVFLAGALLLTQLAPAFEKAIPRWHPVVKHGNSALAAKMAVKLCNPVPLVWFCQGNEVNPPSFIYVCPDASGQKCGGVIVGTKGTILTAAVYPCSRWFEIVAGCKVTEIEEALVEPACIMEVPDESSGGQ